MLSFKQHPLICSFSFTLPYKHKVTVFRWNWPFFYYLTLLDKQGLMRQLVLVPGADATHHICPSSKPQLAAMSVPLILLDLPVTGREGDSHLSTHSNLQMYFFLTRSQHTTTSLSALPFFGLFSSSLFPPFPLWPDRKPSKKGRRVEVGARRSCSEKLQGELWFNPQRRGLYLCDGTAWIAVLQGEDAHPGLFTYWLGSESNKPVTVLTC